MDLDQMQTLATVGATLAAIAAIGFGYYQFKGQIYNGNILAHANIKPLLDIERVDLDDKKSISLINHGISSAIITKIEFYKSDTNLATSDLSQLVNLGCKYDQVICYLAGLNYIRPGGEDVLARITREYLRSQKFTEEEINQSLKKWIDIMKGIHIHVTYEDVLEGRQKDLFKVLFI